MDRWRSPRGQFIIALGISSLASVGMLAYSVWRDHSLAHDYLTWNLLLAWLPLIFALRLMTVLRTKLWSSWEGLFTSFVWLVFLPNSFYMISDLIHLQELDHAHILYDSIMYTSFVFTGMLLGFSSLYLIHLQLRRRFTPRAASFWVGLMLLLCSAAIYLGRDLRWNTWDILVNPGGLLFDISDRIQHPAAYPQMMLVISAFFVLLATMYNLLWRGTQLFLRPAHPPARSRHQG
jgi:uncharacterized membrane protein